MKKNINVSWGFLCLGLENNWLSLKEVIIMINNYSSELKCDESSLIDLNVNEDNKSYVLDKLIEKRKGEKLDGVIMWQYLNLSNIKNSEKTIEEKLVDIEKQWARFNYPPEWQKFIYYMPIQGINSQEEVYQFFLNYLNKLDLMMRK